MRLLAVVLVVAAAGGCPTPIHGLDDAGPGAADSGVLLCVDDQQCGAGFCLNGICSAAECSAKADCASTEICSAAGRCEAPPATCHSSVDCPGTLVCDGFSNTCFDPNNPGGEGEGEGGGGGEGEGGGGEGEGEGAGIDLSGYAIENRENDPVSQAAVLPGGTFLFAGHSLVIGRSANKNDFENFWGTLPDTAFYKSGSGSFPIVNGGEKFALVDPNGNVVDGPTIAGSSGKDYQRTGSGSASSNSNWDTSDATPANATPGTSALSAGSGLKISEWSDASGSGNFDFEFIEITFQP